MHSSFSTLPLEVLEHIAYHLALVDLHGPPTHLLSLLCTSKSIYHALSIQRSPHLYARIFRAKFDCSAVAPRFTQQATYAPVLANQLVRYCLALKNIRRGDIYSPSLLKTFYRAFALCSENDGRNAEQLDWAGLSQFVERYVFERLWEGRASPSYNQWPVESGENAFALWLYWYSLTPQKLAAHTEEQRNYLQILLRPYAVYNFRYPPFLAPDIHFRFPLHGTPDLYHDHSTLTPHGYYPQYREPKYVQHSFTHYDTRVSIAEPPIGLVAKLLYVALIEHQPQEYPAADLLPVDRAEAIAIGVTSGPTLADYYEFGGLRAARPPERGDWDSNEEHSRRKGTQLCSPDAKHLSTLNEIDWERWRGCYDPWNSTTARNHDGYTHAFGSLTGLWGGRYLVSPLAS
ncbi:hypothetical protein C8Q74DRAFT_1192861 [Fomes fomentarius]|nr:hypothetical protein C8Q74DRAFT_1192861 [Fomes fomentarius]